MVVLCVRVVGQISELSVYILLILLSVSSFERKANRMSSSQDELDDESVQGKMQLDDFSVFSAE